MSFTFPANQLVVNLLDSDRMTAGRAYRVHSSYDGHSGCGAQEWCRVAADDGKVVGYDPVRFIAASPEGLAPNKAVCDAALRTLHTLKILMRDFQGESFAAVRAKLEALRDDALMTIAATADYPVRDQITVQDVTSRLPPRSDLSLQCILAVEGNPVGWLRYVKEDQAYSVEVNDQITWLEAENYDEAFAAAKSVILDQAGAQDLSFWAVSTFVHLTPDRQKAFTDALG
ncbi:hypothetical protein MARCHEWKA_03150 [Brevundimonas phage vB_BpoS-Marchewka]|uniref:Uncharacterized protein n=1 Tax=Brevundimonas phage vB_BpoS-Marchewka TaxID=2948604 RepID=A0A9E7N5I8_9CAUD|nr:hypothetical protein MARCHEWKA_03150 [Brevundimonas phage vB_BpoS-Marchewka]UTC29274.1 hypothetical protein BAMBUS_01920 [Brevundimonas phage vB_BpoS-Bambus]